MNKVMLIGNIATEPEIRNTQSGSMIGTFALAVTRRFSSRDGERETDFLNIVVFGKTAENIGKYLGKGKRIAISGRVEVDRWEDAEGNKRSTVKIKADEVEFLSPINSDAKNSTHDAEESDSDSNDALPF